MKKLFFAIIILFTCSINSFAQKYNPVADAKAIVQVDKARFTILTPRVIRMEWSEDGKFEDRASLTIVNRKLPVPKFTKTEKDGKLEINTGEIKLVYTIGSVFNENNLTVQYKLGNELKTWKYGDVNKGNLLGTRRTLDGTNGEFSNPNKPTEKLKLEEGILSKEGWCVIDDSQKPLFDNSEWPWVAARPVKKYMDLYFFGYGYNYKLALKDFTETAGKIALPPKYIFGYWYSRYWPYSQKEVNELIGTFESLNIPLDVFVIDMDWHLTVEKEFFKDGARKTDQAGQNMAWTGFTWDKNLFPYPEDLLAWGKTKNLKMCLNLHPASGVQPHEEKYPEMAKAMGVDPATKKYIPFDITNKQYAKNFFDIILHPMEKMGIDFWWLDWQQWSTTTIPGVNPTFYLNYVFYSDMERQNGKRPFIYHRWGGLGNHRYQIGFSGDTRISWESLDYQPYFTATASNVGFGFWGHDIGGHEGNTDNDPELLTRWFQWGVFSPLLKTHATHETGIKRKIWEYPSENFFIMRDLIDLRYSLVPYIYTAARKAYDDGISLMRPIYYEYPQDENAYKIRNEYYFGDDMIVNPVTRAIGKDSLFTYESTWLPEGNWIEWPTGTMLKGNQTVKRAFMPDEIPIYVKEGAIIPMYPKIKNLETKVDKLILNIFPGSTGKTHIYDDEGNNQNFKNGKYAITNIAYVKTGNKLTVTIEPVKGNFNGMVTMKSYELRLINSFAPLSVKVNGIDVPFSAADKSNSWHYDGEKLSVIISSVKYDVHNKTVFEIALPSEDISLLSGKAGHIKRIYTFTRFLAGAKRFWDQKNWNDGETNSGVFNRSAQMGIILSKNPKNAAAELKQFDLNWLDMMNTLKGVQSSKPMFKPYYDLLINN